MAGSDSEVNLSPGPLRSLRSEQATAIDALQARIKELEAERDQALLGLEQLTQALRRRGCCDHDVVAGSF